MNCVVFVYTYLCTFENVYIFVVVYLWIYWTKHIKHNKEYVYAKCIVSNIENVKQATYKNIS